MAQIILYLPLALHLKVVPSVSAFVFVSPGRLGPLYRRDPLFATLGFSSLRIVPGPRDYVSGVCSADD